MSRRPKDITGPRRGTPTRIRGVDYPSVSEAARQLGVTFSTVFGAMERGTLDACGIPDRTAGYCDGVQYPSKAAAARALGIKPQVLHTRILRGKIKWVPV